MVRGGDGFSLPGVEEIQSKIQNLKSKIQLMVRGGDGVSQPGVKEIQSKIQNLKSKIQSPCGCKIILICVASKSKL